jgi:hypothetical protein
LGEEGGFGDAGAVEAAALGEAGGELAGVGDRPLNIVKSPFDLPGDAVGDMAGVVADMPAYGVGAADDSVSLYNGSESVSCINFTAAGKNSDEGTIPTRLIEV